MEPLHGRLIYLDEFPSKDSERGRALVTSSLSSRQPSRMPSDTAALGLTMDRLLWRQEHQQFRSTQIVSPFLTTNSETGVLAFVSGFHASKDKTNGFYQPR